MFGYARSFHGLLVAVLLLTISCTESRQDIDQVQNTPETPAKEDTYLTVDDIYLNISEYLDRPVEVSGVVEAGLAFEFVTEQPYILKGSENRLWVITNNMSPKDKDFVTVKGILVSPYQIKGRRYELVLLEEKRIQ